MAPSLPWLVAARALQAVGGSMLNPVAMSIITNTFTEPRERARAIGVWRRQWSAPVHAWRSARWSAGRWSGRSAGRPSSGCNLPVRGRLRAVRAVRAGVARAAPPPGGPRRAGAGHRAAGHPDVRLHRGAGGRLGLAGRTLAAFATPRRWDALACYLVPYVAARRPNPHTTCARFRSTASRPRSSPCAPSRHWAASCVRHTLYPPGRSWPVRLHAASYHALHHAPGSDRICAPLVGRIVRQRGPRPLHRARRSRMAARALIMTGLSATPSAQGRSCRVRCCSGRASAWCERAQHHTPPSVRMPRAPGRRGRTGSWPPDQPPDRP
ncbi:hypothetical protein [Nonomuraea rubra]|uniref:hypothetical protein n=1 Tax=Nonomuraea rubra TaxID=46180 RepID=UPI0031EFAD3B